MTLSASSKLFSTRLKGMLLFLYSGYVLMALAYPSGANVAALSLMVLGFVVTGIWAFQCKKYSYSFKVSLSPETYVLTSFALFSVVSIVSFFYWPHTKEAQMQLEDYGTFLLLIPLYLVLKEFRFNFTHIIVLLAGVACLLGVLSITQYISMKYFGRYIFVGDNPWASMWLRPSGGVNPMRYAAISLIFSCFALNAKLLIRNKSLWIKVLLVFAIFLGLVACLLTQVRGAWLALPVLVVFYTVYLYKVGDKKLLVAVFVGGVLTIGGGSQTEVFQKRFSKTLNSVNAYNQQGRTGSAIGARLDMFEAALILISDRPVWGYGLNSYKAYAAGVRENIPSMSWQVGHWHNPHNEILNTMVEKGIIGLITLALLFIAPAYLFIRSLYLNSPQVKFYAMSGLSILIVYMVAGQSVALFSHDVFNHFFVLMILLFVSQISIIKRQDLKLQS